MTPFRDKPIKWDGKDEGGRYKDQDGYKFDIVVQNVVKKVEEMPKCFLADTLKEAESIYSQYEKMLNKLAHSYSVSTGINKADLFGEALIGLARAYRDWNPERSDNFQTYAIFVIKDSLNEYVKDNYSSVTVPAYVKKSNVHLRKIKDICDKYKINWRIIAVEQELPDELEVEDAIECTKLVKNIIRASERAKVTYEDFIERIEIIPQDVEYTETMIRTSKREAEKVEATILANKLKKYMDKDELYICEGIMEDKSFEQIAKEMNKSKGWVSGKLKLFRERMFSIVEDNSL